MELDIYQFVKSNSVTDTQQCFPHERLSAILFNKNEQAVFIAGKLLLANTAHQLLARPPAIETGKMLSFQSALRDQATDCAGFLPSDSPVMVDQQELRGNKNALQLTFSFAKRRGGGKKDKIQARDVSLRSQLRYALDK